MLADTCIPFIAPLPMSSSPATRSPNALSGGRDAH
jgi:hypothetical protein